MLCGLLVLVLLIQRPTAWPALLALVVLWGVVVVLFRCQLRKWVARWMCGGSFEGSKLQFSLEPLSQPAALLSGETVLWYNAQFRTRLLNGQDALVNRVQKVLPGLDLQQCRKQEGQLLTLADGMWSVHSSTVPGDAESMTLLGAERGNRPAQGGGGIQSQPSGLSGVSGGRLRRCVRLTCWTASVPACWKASTARWRI